MDSTKDFVADFWANLDGWLVFFNVSSGILLGTVGGLALVIWLQKSGLLGRNNRWHYLLLKLYFLALPCLGGFLGFQAGMLHSPEKQIHREIDRQHDAVQVHTLSMMHSFYTHMSQTAPERDPAELASMSMRDMLILMAHDFIDANPIAIYDNPDDLNWRQRLAQTSVEIVRERILIWAVDEIIVPRVVATSANKYTYLSPDVINEIVHEPLDTLFNARALLDFVKKQVSRIWSSYYMAVGIQLLVLLLLIGSEYGLSRYFKQLKLRHPAASPAPAARHEAA